MEGDPAVVGDRGDRPQVSFGHPLGGAEPYGGTRTASTTSAGVIPRRPGRRPSRSGCTPLVVGALVFALVAAALVARAASVSHRPERALGGNPVASSPINPDSAAQTSAAAQGLLTARSRAVSSHDEKAFLAGVDPANSVFVDRQRQLFASLTSLPLAVVRWVLRPSGEYNRPGLATRYGAPVFVTDVEFDYQLMSYDPAPVASAQTITFVRRAGGWVLGGDSDLDNLLPEGGHAEPWDIGPIDVVRGAHALVIGTPQDHDALRELARVADAAAEAVAARWSDGWSHTVVLYAPRDRRVIATYFRSDLQSVDAAAAVQVEVFDGVREWNDRAEVVGSRVIFNPTYTRPGDARLPTLLRHEFTHVATRSATSAATPTWLVEGYAEYTAYLGDAGGRGVSAAVADDAVAGRLLPYLPPSVDFYSVEGNYDRSWLLCLYLGRRYGPDQLKALYAYPARMHLTDRTEAAQLAFRSVLGISQGQLLKNVNAWASHEVRAP